VNGAGSASQQKDQLAIRARWLAILDHERPLRHRLLESTPSALLLTFPVHLSVTNRLANTDRIKCRKASKRRRRETPAGHSRNCNLLRTLAF